MLMGGWNREQAAVFLCAASIRAQGMDQEEILRHELIHVIQDLQRGSLLPEPLLSILSREYIPSGEAMVVIFDYESAMKTGDVRVIDLTRDLPLFGKYEDGAIFGLKK